MEEFRQRLEILHSLGNWSQKKKKESTRASFGNRGGKRKKIWGVSGKGFPEKA